MIHRSSASWITVTCLLVVRPVLVAMLMGLVMAMCAGCCQPFGCMTANCGPECVDCCAAGVGCSRRLRDCFGPPAGPVVQNEQATFVTQSKYHPVPTRPVFSRRDSIVFSGEEIDTPIQAPSVDATTDGPSERVPMETELMPPHVPGPADYMPQPGVMGPIEREPLADPEDAEDAELIGPGDSAAPEHDDSGEDVSPTLPSPLRGASGAASVRPPGSANILRGPQRHSVRSRAVARRVARPSGSYRSSAY